MVVSTVEHPDTNRLDYQNVVKIPYESIGRLIDLCPLSTNDGETFQLITI
jgi:hypothetical protein